MRKCEQQIIRAIRSNRDRTIGNTAVTHTPDHTQIRLHGNLIAIVRPDYLHLTFAGWPTVTTKSRLNALLDAFRPSPYGVGFYQRQYQMYLAYGGQTYALDPQDSIQITSSAVNHYAH